MPIKWKKGFDADLLFRELDNARVMNKEKTSFRCMMSGSFALLESMLDVDKNIPAGVARGLIMRGFGANQKLNT